MAQLHSELKMRTEEELKDRIRHAVIQEIQISNVITNAQEPERYIPVFVENLTRTISEIVLDEIMFRRK